MEYPHGLNPLDSPVAQTSSRQVWYAKMQGHFLEAHKLQLPHRNDFIMCEEHIVQLA